MLRCNFFTVLGWCTDGLGVPLVTVAFAAAVEKLSLEKEKIPCRALQCPVLEGMCAGHHIRAILLPNACSVRCAFMSGEEGLTWEITPEIHYPPPLSKIGRIFCFVAFGIVLCSCLLCTLYCIPCSAVVTSICLLHFGSLDYSYGIWVYEVVEA